MEKLVDITAKRDGFRRAGMVHSDKTKTYPLSDFTKKQLKALQDEPMLVVAIRDPNEGGNVVQQLRDELLQANDRNVVLQGQLDDITRQLHDANGQVKTLTDAQSEAGSSVASFKQQLEANDKVLSEMVANYDAEKLKTADLQEKLAAADKALKAANKGK